MKGPKDRLLMMTETVDQSFQKVPRDENGHYGGRTFLPYESQKLKKRLDSERQLKIAEEMQL